MWQKKAKATAKVQWASNEGAPYKCPSAFKYVAPTKDKPSRQANKFVSQCDSMLIAVDGHRLVYLSPRQGASKSQIWSKLKIYQVTVRMWGGWRFEGAVVMQGVRKTCGKLGTAISG